MKKLYVVFVLCSLSIAHYALCVTYYLSTFCRITMRSLHLPKSKRRLHLISIFLYFYVSCFCLYASDIFERLEVVENETRSASFDFEQSIEFDLQNYKQQNEGSVIFEKPNNFRMEISRPYKQLTISDGKKFYNYNSQTNQAVITGWGRMKKTGMLYGWPENFASNFGEVRKKYNMKLIETTTEYFLISLDDKKAEFVMNFYFEPGTLAVRKTEFATKGTKIITEIKNYKKNPTIKKDTFKFTPPKGAEIIK